jgi:predicted dithiol-disulfide oxidoreductase (DUF899 family)
MWPFRSAETEMTDQVADANPAHCCESPAVTGSEVSANRSEIDRQIDALEAEVGKLQGKVAELRRRRQHEVVKDYVFHDWNGAQVRLSDLTDGRADLILVHNMGADCSYCTMWADGFVGLLPHLQSRAAFVVVSPDPIDVQEAFARSRGWPFRMVSAHGTPFFRDMGFTDGTGAPMPGVSVFQRAPDGTMARVQRAEFGPGDQFCAVWHFFDLLADGVANWEPRLSY